MPIIQGAFVLGYELWWDEGIPGGVEWLRHLEEKVDRAMFFLLFLSWCSAASEFVGKEIEFALREREAGRHRAARSRRITAGFIGVLWRAPNAGRLGSVF